MRDDVERLIDGLPSAPLMRITGCREAFALNGITVVNPEQLIAFHALKCANNSRHRWVCREPVPAVINHGRWLVGCPHCNTGIDVDPDWQLGVCFGCGGIYVAVMLPTNRAEIEALLVQRPRTAQNWTPGETVEDLVRDNARHGVTA